MKKLLLFLLLFQTQLYAQSLSPERVAHIKRSTVKVIVENGNSSGTGFVVDNAGSIVTCWHVVRNFIITNATNQITGTRKIIVEFTNGVKKEYGVPTDFINKSAKELLSYDICLLIPLTKSNQPIEFLKVGKFANLNEGDEVVTCGYPFSLPKQFISKGMVSTKFIDTLSFNNNGVIQKTVVNMALIDITMNKGNSGGPIVKLGSDINSDEVIGVADFIITPVGKDVTDMLADLNRTNKSGGSVEINGINPNTSLEKLTTVITNMSNGISGCIAIDHLQNLIDSIKKQ